MTKQERFNPKSALQVMTSTLLLISLISPLAAFGQTSAQSSPSHESEGAPSYQIAVCMLDNKPEVFVMLSGNEGEVEVIGRDATVTVDDKALTLIEGTTVYQFLGVKVARLRGGNVAISTCSDITAETISIARALVGAEVATPIEIIPLAQSAPSGPPMSSGEKDALPLAVQACWNVDPGARWAKTTVTVAMDMTRDGKVVASSLRMIASAGGDASTANAAFGAARRAILLCQNDGYPLPPEKYVRWQEIELTFNPERMLIR